MQILVHLFTYGCLYSPYWWHLFSSETPFLAYIKYFIMLSEHHTCMVLANQKLRFWKHLIKNFIFLIVILTRCVIKQLSLSISQTAWPPGCPSQLSLRSRVKTLVLDCQNTCHILRSTSQVPNTWVLIGWFREIELNNEKSKKWYNVSNWYMYMYHPSNIIFSQWGDVLDT